MSFVDELRKEVEAAPIESELIGGYTFPSGKGVHPPGSVEDRLHKIEFALGALRQGLMLTARKVAEIEEKGENRA